MASDEAKPDHLEADPLDALERLPPSDERREDEVAERSVVEEQCTQRVSVDRDVAQRFGHDRRHEHGLSGQEIQFAEKARGAVAGDLVTGRVTDRHLALTNGDKTDNARSPTRYNTSSTAAVRSSPRAPSLANCEAESEGIGGTLIRRG